MLEKAEAVRCLQLYARQFRNLEPLDVTFGPRFNVISGDNGQGKSNLLEAIAYLVSLRSFRGAPTSELIERDVASATIACKLEARGSSRTLKVRLHRERARDLALDDKRPRTLSRWRSVGPSVVFHPGDLELAQGGPEARRALLDAILTEVELAYEAALSSYQRALRSRNRLLRAETVDRRAIGAYNGVLASTGAELVRSRARLVSEIAPMTERCFGALFGAEVPVSVRYAPRVEGGEAEIAEALERSLELDLARGFTAEGPHADDLALEVRSRGARHHASQGQQRTLVLALKAAELELMSSRVGMVPILLLDDVSSELDRVRNRRLFELLGGVAAQVFVTTTHRELIQLERDRVDWSMRSGHLERMA